MSEDQMKNKLECFAILVETLTKIQAGLSISYKEDYNLRDQLLSACKNIPECEVALNDPKSSFYDVKAQLQNAIYNRIQFSNSEQYNTNATQLGQTEDFGNQFWTERRYIGRGGDGRGIGQGKHISYEWRELHERRQDRGNINNNINDNYSRPLNYRHTANLAKLKCFVCGKSGCWSNKHTHEERQKGFRKFQQQAFHLSRDGILSAFQAFLASVEGVEGLTETYQGEEDIEKINQFLLELDFQEDTHDYVEQYISDCGSVNPRQTISILNNQSTFHAVTKYDMFKKDADTKHYQIESRYSERELHRIMPDSAAAGVSTAGKPQFLALQKIFPSIQLDTSRAGECNIRFGISNATSFSTVKVPTPLGPITFHVVPANKPFLFCIQEMDKSGVKLDNLRNILVQGVKKIPIIRKFGHPFMMLACHEQSIAWSHLTESQLCKFHRRFGNPCLQKLHKVLERAGLEVDVKLIKKLTKYCHQCQMHGKSPGRFKVTLPKEYDFNYEVVIDIFYIDGKPVLHVVDTSTTFQAARFVSNLSAEMVWEDLLMSI